MPLMIFFTLDEATRLIGLEPKDKWRVIKFVQGREYGLKSSVRKARGSGSRRLYELNDVCELALALRLLETGLRSKVIGKIINQLREKEDGRGNVNALDSVRLGHAEIQLAIIRTPQVGKPLDEKREQNVQWVRTVGEAEELRRLNPNRDLILVPVGALFSQFDKELTVILNRKI
jgi:DNA-binding transcriptional MerR regulator